MASAGRNGQAWLMRLRDARGVMLGAAAVFGVLALWARLPPGFALGGWLVIALLAFIAARPSANGTASAPSGRQESFLPSAVRRFADTLAEPCFITDRRGIVRHANPAARHEFSATLVGDPITLSLRAPAMRQAIDAARATGQAQVFEWHYKGSTERWFRVAVAAMAPAGTAGTASRDQSELLVLHMADLTDQHRLDVLRSDFIANVSHELRTPLTSLIGFIDTLVGPAARDAEARARFLAIMRAQAERMSRLVDDLLSLSRIELHQHQRPQGDVDIALLVREVVSSLSARAAEAGLEIRLEAPERDAIVTGDRRELFEVFENLVENALKYGASGKAVDVVLTPDADDFAWRVVVTDYGPGVASEHVPRLTERFYRVDAESSRRKKGTGLGLAIVKHIVGRHRGRLTIHSAPGEGMRIEVRLPR